MLAAAAPESCRQEPQAGSGAASIGISKGTVVVWEIKSGRAELQPNFSTMSSLNAGLVSGKTSALQLNVNQLVTVAGKHCMPCEDCRS